MSAREELDPSSSVQHTSRMLLLGAGTWNLSPKESEGCADEPMNSVRRLDQDESVHALAELKPKAGVSGESKESRSEPQSDEAHPMDLSIRFNAENRSIASRAGSMQDTSRQLESREDQRIRRSAHLHQWLAEQEKEQPGCRMVVTKEGNAGASNPNEDKNSHSK